MNNKYSSDIQDAQKTIFREIRPTVEHFWTDVCDSTYSVKGQNVNEQAQLPSFQDVLNFFVLFTQASFMIKAEME